MVAAVRAAMENTLVSGAQEAAQARWNILFREALTPQN
jgi:hypothetical protein